ncbi:MAG: dihydrolipoyl dehydrogenase [Xanthobacteraceae bacterium]
MANPAYDLIVIGSGPGGYVCAIRAAQLGMKVAVVEKDKTFGGTCLNVGCIPSKALLHASERYEETGLLFDKMGIKVGKPKLDLAAMMKFKDEGVDGNVKGVAYLLKKNKIDTVQGTGRIAAPGKVEVKSAGGKSETLEAKAIVIATGSDVARLPGIDIDEKRVVSSTGALVLDKVPERLLVVGAGVIGLELGSVWRRLGSDVIVVEFLDRILPGIDNEVCRQFQRILERQGIKFKLSSKVTAVDANGKTLKASVEPAAGGAAETIEADVVLVSIGRVPFTGGLGLEGVGVKTDNKGRVMVDEHFATNVPGVYAIGDVIAGPMLAHKAEDEGVAVAEIIAGQAGHVNYDVIPNVVYTFPEIASVGKSEEELKAAGVAFNVGKFPFTANGRAKINHQTDGFVKILADAKTDRVLGVHIVGADAGNMIAEAAVAMEFGAASEDIARTCHAHPTLTEAVKEAALAVAKRSINM